MKLKDKIIEVFNELILQKKPEYKIASRKRYLAYKIRKFVREQDKIEIDYSLLDLDNYDNLANQISNKAKEFVSDFSTIDQRIQKKINNDPKAEKIELEEVISGKGTLCCQFSYVVSFGYTSL